MTSSPSGEKVVCPLLLLLLEDFEKSSFVSSAGVEAVEEKNQRRDASWQL